MSCYFDNKWVKYYIIHGPGKDGYSPEIKRYLQQNPEKKRNSIERAIRKASKSYYVSSSGILCRKVHKGKEDDFAKKAQGEKKRGRKKTPKGDEIDYNANVRYVYNEIEKLDLCYRYHNRLGCPNWSDVWKAIKENWYWVGFVDYIKDYIDNCSDCGNDRPGKKKVTPPLFFIDIEDQKVGEVFNVDLVDVGQDDYGYRYLFHAVSSLSKIKFVIPQKSKTAEDTLVSFKALVKWVEENCENSLQFKIVDRGGEFNNEEDDKYRKKKGIGKRRTRGRNPKCNGNVESPNKQLKKRLRRIVSNHGKKMNEWSRCVDQLRVAMKSGFNRVINKRPKDAFNEMQKQYWVERMNLPEDEAKKMSFLFTAIIKNNIWRSREEKQREWYKIHDIQDLYVGDFVVLKYDTLEKSKKMRFHIGIIFEKILATAYRCIYLQNDDKYGVKEGSISKVYYIQQIRKKHVSKSLEKKGQEFLKKNLSDQDNKKNEVRKNRLDRSLLWVKENKIRIDTGECEVLVRHVDKRLNLFIGKANHVDELNLKLPVKVSGVFPDLSNEIAWKFVCGQNFWVDLLKYSVRILTDDEFKDLKMLTKKEMSSLRSQFFDSFFDKKTNVQILEPLLDSLKGTSGEKKKLIGFLLETGSISCFRSLLNGAQTVFVKLEKFKVCEESFQKDEFDEQSEEESEFYSKVFGKCPRNTSSVSENKPTNMEESFLQIFEEFVDYPDVCDYEMKFQEECNRILLEMARIVEESGHDEVFEMGEMIEILKKTVQEKVAIKILKELIFIGCVCIKKKEQGFFVLLNYKHQLFSEQFDNLLERKKELNNRLRKKAQDNRGWGNQEFRNSFFGSALQYYERGIEIMDRISGTDECEDIVQKGALFFNIALCLAKMSQFEKALVFTNKCLSIQTHHVKCLLLKAKILVEMEEFDVSVEILQKLSNHQSVITSEKARFQLFEARKKHSMYCLGIKELVNVRNLLGRYRTLLKRFHTDIVGYNKITTKVHTKINSSFAFLKENIKKVVVKSGGYCERDHFDVGINNREVTCYMSAIMTSIRSSFFEEILERKDISVDTDSQITPNHAMNLMYSLLIECSLYCRFFEINRIIGCLSQVNPTWFNRVGTFQDAGEFLDVLVNIFMMESPGINPFQECEGKYSSTICCEECGKKSFHGPVRFHQFQLPLPIVTNQVGVLGLFNSFLRTEIISYKCESCEMESHTRYFDVESFPKILILQLKRMSSHGRNILFRDDVVVNVELSIDFETKKFSSKYKLFAVVCFLKRIEHYVSICRSTVNRDVWLKFDDEKVEELSQFPSEFVSNTAYILMYRQQEVLSKRIPGKIDMMNEPDERVLFDRRNLQRINGHEALEKKNLEKEKRKLEEMRNKLEEEKRNKFEEMRNKFEEEKIKKFEEEKRKKIEEEKRKKIEEEKRKKIEEEKRKKIEEEKRKKIEEEKRKKIEEEKRKKIEEEKRKKIEEEKRKKIEEEKRKKIEEEKRKKIEEEKRKKIEEEKRKKIEEEKRKKIEEEKRIKVGKELDELRSIQREFIKSQTDLNSKKPDITDWEKDLMDDDDIPKRKPKRKRKQKRMHSHKAVKVDKRDVSASRSSLRIRIHWKCIICSVLIRTLIPNDHFVSSEKMILQCSECEEYVHRWCVVNAWSGDSVEKTGYLCRFCV